MRNSRGVIMLLLCVLLTLTSCGRSSSSTPEVTPDQPNEREQAPEETQDPVPVEDTELSDPNRDWEPIDTKFGRLCYPDDLFEYLQTEQTETEEEVKVMFRAEIGDLQIDMFEITIGKNGDEPAGTITGPDNVMRDVYLRLIPIEDLSGLSEGEENRVYAMQEALNFVLDHLK